MASPETASDHPNVNMEERMRYYREKVELTKRENKQILSKFNSAQIYDGKMSDIFYYYLN